MKNILVILGSPRHSGNSEALADAFIAGAEKSGNTVTKVSLAHKRIAGCLDCKYCRAHGGECVQKDSMQAIYPALRQADMVVFATPVYYFGFPSQIKAVIDRFYAAETCHFPVTSSVLLTVCADSHMSIFEPIISNYTNITKYLGWENYGVVAVPGVSDRGEISGNPGLLEATKLGESIK